MKKKFKFKKLLNEYRSHSYELKYIEEVLKDGLSDFEIYYRQYCINNDIDLRSLNNKNATRVDQIFSDSKGVQKFSDKKSRINEFDSKYIFRQIARKFHPDVLPQDDPRATEYEEIFKKATCAIENGEWGNLFDIADQHNIELRDYDSINESLSRSIKRVKKEIEKQKTTYAWILFNCDEDEPCRENVVKQFLKHLFNI